MIFTILSRYMGSHTGSSRDFFYLFLVGAVIYSVIHWYLFKELKNSFPLNYVRRYFYYIVGVDLVVAYILLSMIPPVEKKGKKEISKQNNDDINMRMEQQKRINQMRMLQEQKEKEKKESNEKVVEKVIEKVVEKSEPKQQVELRESENDRKNVEDNKASIFSSSNSDDSESEDSIEEDKVETKNKKVVKKNINNKIKNDNVKNAEENDTELPVYKSE